MRYQLFGETVESPWALPLPRQPDDHPVSVRIHAGRVPAHGERLWQASDPARPFVCLRAPDGGFVLAWPGACFHVSEGEVLVDAADPELAIPLLLQPAWSVVLMMRGVVPLHGSAVERGGRAVAILGASGDGKSTAALRMVERGWRLITDDLLAVDGELSVAPAPAFLRLDRTGEPAGAEPTDPDDKIRVPVRGVTTAVKLTSALVLSARDDAPWPLRGSAAVGALLEHLYNPIPLGIGERRRALAVAAAIAGRVPVRIARPRSLTAAEIEAYAGEDPA